MQYSDLGHEDKLLSGSILQRSCHQQIQRLRLLHKRKSIDRFLEDFELLQKNNVQIESANRQFFPEIDLSVKHQEMRRFLQQMSLDIAISRSEYAGWSTAQVDEHCQIGIRNNGTQVQLRGSGRIMSSAKKLILMVYLIKLYKEWVPFCKQSYQVSELSPLEKVAFVRIKVPFIKDRCAFVRGVGFDRIASSNTICIFAEGITNKDLLAKEHIDFAKAIAGCELLDLKHITLELKYKGAEVCQFTGYALLDHHIELLPDKLVEFIVKQIAKGLFKDAIRRLVKFEDTPWAKEIKQSYSQNADFYEWLDHRMKQWDQQNDSK